MDPIAVLAVTSGIVMFATQIYVSSKTGYIVGMGIRNEPKFEIRKDRIGRFISILGIVLVANILCCLVVIGDIHEIGAALIMSAINTVAIGYGLTYGFLLQEKKAKN